MLLPGVGIMAELATCVIVPCEKMPAAGSPLMARHEHWDEQEREHEHEHEQQPGSSPAAAVVPMRATSHQCPQAPPCQRMTGAHTGCRGRRPAAAASHPLPPFYQPLADCPPGVDQLHDSGALQGAPFAVQTAASRAAAPPWHVFTVDSCPNSSPPHGKRSEMF